MLRSWSAVLALPLCLVLVGGCTDDPPARPPAQATAAVDQSADMNDGAAAETCQELAAAVEYGTLMEAGVVETIVTSAAKAGAAITASARALEAAYQAAVDSHDTESEPDAIAAVSAAGATMVELCDASAPDSVG